MKEKKLFALSILALISLVLITVGVTYAFFNYAKTGLTENSVKTGSITFIYEEVEAQGAGISISDAFPMSDENGKAQVGTGKVFNFKVKSKTMSNTSMPYTVTARMKKDSTLDESAVKIYLTEVSADIETELLLNTYNNLNQTSVDVPEGTIEKVIYTDTVPAGSTNYEKNFRLRMWISDAIKFSQNADGTYPYNGKTFALTVNVYANGTVVEEENNLTAANVFYSNDKSEKCTTDQTISCSLNELYEKLTETN